MKITSRKTTKLAAIRDHPSLYLQTHNLDKLIMKSPQK